LSGLFNLQNLQAFSWLTAGSVLVASLIGSIHCLSMCGPLILNLASNKQRLIAYHIGRGITYISAGALSGAFGQSVLNTTRHPWVSELSLAFIALILIFMGARTLSGNRLHLRLPRPIEILSRTLWSKLRLASLPTGITAFLGGALTILLPCGHLYGFLIGAMATGHWWTGALFMTAFWTGTLPALAFGASWLRSILTPSLEKAPRLTGSLLIVAGLLGLATFAARLNAICH
jgi:sulfite exporter TauE/SafE